MSHAATSCAVLAAIAKQSPCAGRITAVFTPMTFPEEFTSGPRISGIQCCVRLNNIVHQPARLGPHRSAQSTDHSGRDSLLETVGTADRYRNLADPQLFGIGKRKERKLRGVDANDGQIGVRIISNQRRAEVRASCKVTSIDLAPCTT